jgi:hypothetical protein
VTVATALTIATPTTGLFGTADSAFSLAVPGAGGRASLSYVLTGELVDGLSFATSTGTISGTPTVAGTSTVSVTVTDANGATASTSNFTVSVGYASTTVSLALAAGSPQYRTTKRITATTSRAGSVNFKLGGVSIDGCESVAAATTTATCDWVPVDLGAAALSAVFTPTASTAYSNSTTSLSTTVAARAITVTPVEVGRDRSTLRVPKSVSDGLHHLVMVGVDRANTEAKFEVGINVGVPAKQWWLSRWLLIIPITLAVFIGFWLPTTARRRKRRATI